MMTALDIAARLIAQSHSSKEIRTLTGLRGPVLVGEYRSARLPGIPVLHSVFGEVCEAAALDFVQ